jgi:hypothetical protein
MEGDKRFPRGKREPQSKADTPAQAYLVWRFLSKSPDGYPILGLDYAESPPGHYGDQFAFDDKIIPKRFNDAARPASCQRTPNLISKRPWPEFQRLVDERDLLLERDGDRRPGLIPQVNDLNGRIAITESILKIAQSAREAALRFKRDVE